MPKRKYAIAVWNGRDKGTVLHWRPDCPITNRQLQASSKASWRYATPADIRTKRECHFCALKEKA
jgi:hypothetical protein